MQHQEPKDMIKQPIMSELRVSLIGAVLVALGPLSLALYTPAMPEIVHAFGTTEAAVKLTLSTYFAGFALAQLVCGPFSDAFGRKPISFAFMAIYSVASLIAVLAINIEMLIVARFLQGVGAAAGVAISRALVRDLFTHERSARIMNLIGIILSIGPALAPTLGGFTMEIAGWHAIFLLMFAAGFIVSIIVKFFMVETVPVKDPSRASLKGLLRSYKVLFQNKYFLLTATIMAGSVGALYTLATVLPFILMERLGLSPSEFGIGMIMQSGMFFVGTIVMHYMMKRYKSYNLIPVGLIFIAIASLSILILPHVFPLSFMLIMMPVACYTFGITFVLPAMMTSSMAPFPHMAGAASAMAGFIQMSTGLIGSSLAALIGDPILALSLIIPGMGTTAIVAWFLWRQLPEPAHAKMVISQPSPV